MDKSVFSIRLKLALLLLKKGLRDIGGLARDHLLLFFGIESELQVFFRSRTRRHVLGFERRAASEYSVGFEENLRSSCPI